MIPFRYYGPHYEGWHTEQFLAANPNSVHRLKVYRKFIGLRFIKGHSLDVGDPEYISMQLEVRDQAAVSHNFVSAPASRYKVITFFEVLHHLMNPLRIMLQIHDLLDEGGVCYLSVPKLWLIPWFHSERDFVNYDPKRLKQLFEFAGFKVIRCETHSPWPWWFMFYGVRPLLRVLFNRITVWELRK